VHISAAVEEIRVTDIEQCVREYARSLDRPSRRMQLAIKRALDFIIATLVFIFLTPLLGLLIVLIRLESQGAAIYSQRRLGRYGRIFTIYKLRSMRSGCEVVLNADGSTRVLENDARLTRLGKYMRTIGLDELPQLINIIAGDMSLVGPRPDQEFHLSLYQQSDYRKLALSPGITSLGQIEGRNAILWKERSAWEIKYVEQFSLWLDLKIIMRTFAVILNGVGAYNIDRSLEKSPAASRSAHLSKNRTEAND